MPAWAVSLLLAGAAWAHGGAHDTLTLSLLDDGVRLRATPPIRIFAGLDGGDGVLSDAELVAQEAALGARLLERVRIVDDAGRGGTVEDLVVERHDRGHGHGPQVQVKARLVWAAPVDGLSVVVADIGPALDLHVRVGQDIQTRRLRASDSGVPLRLRGEGPPAPPLPTAPNPSDP